jgi:hypothetical protein
MSTESNRGYTVVALRPSFRGDGVTEVSSVGSIWSDIEPCENHKVYCQELAKRDPKKYGGDVSYAIVKLVEVEQDVTP